MSIESKRRLILLIIAYTFALIASTLFIVYLCKDGLRKGTDSYTIHFVDFAMLSGGFFLVFKGLADNIKSYRVTPADRHFWWMYSRVQMVFGVLVVIGGLISTIIHFI